MNTNALVRENMELKVRLLEREKEISTLKASVDLLAEQVRLLQSLHFGPSSEKLTVEDRRQGRLFNEAEDEAFTQADEQKMALAKETVEVGPYVRRKNRNQGRKAISADLPREEVIYDIAEEEKICGCGCKKKCIGEEVSERVRIKPVEVKVVRERKLKYACRNCEGTEDDTPGVVTAKGPKHLIAGSMADESLLAWMVTEKFEFALPFYRQEKRLEYIGVSVPRATLSNLAIRTAEECAVLYELLVEHIRSGSVINADETRVQVLKEPGRKATDLSWMWVFCGGSQDKQAVVFRYDTGRSSKVAKEFLDGYSGWLQTDDYEAYHTALKELNAERAEGERIRHLLCWAHARRRFFKAWQITKSDDSKRALEWIRDLFALEELRKGFSVRGFHKQRKARALLILDPFKKWMQDRFSQVPPKSSLGQALSYTLDNWEQLVLYLEDPELTPSNNRAENAIRPFVVGRKNWLFSGTPEGAKASSILYSLIESAKLSKLNPYDYLYYIFRKLPYAESDQDRKNLLPFNLNLEILQGG